ncbi:STAS domain-containing protein [Streptomyces sp. NPDC087917]|uniref:STAS domain-containing protein n=1 Tax=Streptomyces sp. NPDC087917 TaxID=3155060 RepID=UPI003419836B
MEPFFEATVRSVGDSVVVTLGGEIDLLVEADLSLLLRNLPAGAAVVDMSQVSFMDLTGLHFIITLRERARRSGTGLLVIGLQSQPQRLLDLAGEVGALAAPASTSAAEGLRARLEVRARLGRLVGEARAGQVAGTALDFTVRRP